jgi:hypothetical protein
MVRERKKLTDGMLNKHPKKGFGIYNFQISRIEK